MGPSTEFWKQDGWRALELQSREAFLTELASRTSRNGPNDLVAMAWK
jgi:homoserine O-acetyltransferase